MKPAVLIEDRMEDETDRRADVPWPSDFQPPWRILCARSFLHDDPSGAPGFSRQLRLGPGQGIRIRVEEDAVRVERMSL